ncbi:DUF5317 domain-containing protein [Caloranaerobacter azorensis]|uniref:DUF5317 domain-containing protein n=2 Tax=Caloranaerobacter azorensis TaxID=116090 RepID=A0A096BGV2_9FIRM|nr:DUF5317 domain-containing protein [Caloranaerobacter azorensis]KGG80097.1 hypothetical protein Y919_08195 [Caloranaerobacter azorensis H53214]QIB27062.1 DUF5317 domain-containing protein [Caloranaerobacter azorensis]
MLIESMATSLVVGKVRGGKLENIGKVQIRGWYFFVLGFIIEFTSVYLKMKNIGIISTFINKYFIYVHSLSYILIFIGLILNFKNKSMILVFIGTLLNFIVIVANGGRMPVSPEGLKTAGLISNLEMLKNDMIITHTLITDSTKLSILGDIIPLSKPYPFPKMISIGDIFLGLGIFCFIQGAMTKKGIFSRKSKMIRFEYKKR